MIDAPRSRLERLIDTGRGLHGQLALDSSDAQALGATRVWQHECAAIVNELSGGSKAHWLARAFSEALLVRSASGHAVEAAPIAAIVERIVEVLGRAAGALATREETPQSANRPDPPLPRRFDFVGDATLRPILGAAYLDSRRALEQHRFGVAMVTFCGILEAVVTDALTQVDRQVLAVHGAPEAPLAAWSFEARIASAERAGLIRAGCARLPLAALRYRELTDASGELRDDAQVSERDARITGQVLHVVLRDLDPGR